MPPAGVCPLDDRVPSFPGELLITCSSEFVAVGHGAQFSGVPRLITNNENQYQRQPSFIHDAAAQATHAAPKNQVRGRVPLARTNRWPALNITQFAAHAWPTDAQDKYQVVVSNCQVLFAPYRTMGPGALGSDPDQGDSRCTCCWMIAEQVKHHMVVCPVPLTPPTQCKYYKGSSYGTARRSLLPLRVSKSHATSTTSRLT